MPWQVDAFAASLTTVADSTKTAYLGDVGHFVEWAERADLDGPVDVTRLVLRRCLASPTTMRRKKPTIAKPAGPPRPGHRSDAGRRAVPEPQRQPARAARRAARARPAGAVANPSPRSSAQLRHASARWRSRPASCSGAAGACKPADHAGLHSREQGAALARVRRHTSSGIGNFVDNDDERSAIEQIWAEYKS